MQLNIDVNNLTIAEVEVFEAVAGVNIGQLAAGPVPAKALRALVYVQMARTDPTFTIEDAGNVTIGSIEYGGATNPPAAAGQAAS